MKVKECPRCREPVNGVTCRSCGLNVEQAQTVRCAGCDRETLQDIAEKKTYQKPISAGFVTKYRCPDCQ